MEKTMRYVNLTFWEKLFSTIRRLNFPKNVKNILDYHIMDADLHGRNKPETIKQILMPRSTVSILNPIWQEKSWETRKLVNKLGLSCAKLRSRKAYQSTHFSSH